MLTPHIEQTVQRIREHDTVLILQDSTYLDYNNRPKTQDLDLTFRSKLNKASRGLILHNTLAVSEDGLPLGLLDQRFIKRRSFSGNSYSEKRKNRDWNRAVAEKESARWLDVVKHCHELDLNRTRSVHIADRECDMYEFYRDAAELGENVLVRAARNRSINKQHRREPPSCWLFDHLQSKRAQGRVTIRMQVNGKTKYRDTELSIVFRPITLPPPPNKTVKKDGELPIVPMYAVMATERRPRRNTPPTHWVLLTNMEVSSLEQAIEKVQWYARRWNIELFHKVLKSGCGVENAQLRHADRLKKYVTMKSIVAWRLFWLSRLQQHTPDASCETILAPSEWSILYRKTLKTSSVPKRAPTVAEAVVWIARLGGYINRATDPPPGMISLWRGWQRLMDMVEDISDIYG